MTKLDFPRDGRHIFADGEWTALEGAEKIPCISPIDEKVIGHIAAARREDVNRAVAAIHPAAGPWGALSVAERVAYLIRFGEKMREHGDQLAEIETLDGGLTSSSARSNVGKCIGWISEYCSFAAELKGTTYPADPNQLLYTRREPYGIVARITPFNHPMNAVVQAILPSLLAGNATIVKPPEQCSLSALALAAIAQETLPAGVLNVVTGYGGEAGQSLVTHPEIRRIGFTGSVSTARRLMADAATGIKHVTLELGGKNPLVITADADPDFAAAVAMRGMNFGHAGQSCMSTSRVLIQEDNYQAVTDRMAEAMNALVIGDPRDKKTDVGPLAFNAHYERVLRYIEVGKSEGAAVLAGGGPAAGFDQGFYVMPTLFGEVLPAMRIATEEIFGPVVSAIRWSDADEAVRIANETKFGLNCRVIAGTLDEGLALGSRIKSGMCFVNTATRLPFGMPFGGSRDSGLGKENCVEEVLSYTQERSYVVGLYH
jgi:acyl-CoA reductase-like NAD-dependent aldehyde dehydrogenase